MLQPAIVRIPLDFIIEAGPLTSFVLADLFVMPLVVWDVGVLRRIHPATLWGGLAVVASLPSRVWISGTQPWLVLAEWAVDLVN